MQQLFFIRASSLCRFIVLVLFIEFVGFVQFVKLVAIAGAQRSAHKGFRCQCSAPPLAASVQSNRKRNIDSIDPPAADPLLEDSSPCGRG
jgi:hypothetical protein